MAARSRSVSRFGAVSDTGRVRKDNQDAWRGDPADGLFLVADGMGGMAGGATASKAVAELLPGLLLKRLDGLPEAAVAGALGEAIAELSAAVRARAAADPALQGMGSTVALALVRGTRAYVANLGDSRAYRLEGKRVRQLSKDHTVVAVMLEKGRITKEQAAVHPLRHSLSRFVGMPGTAAAEVGVLKGRMRLLLCSDGLTNMLPEEAIAAALKAEAEPAAACRRLVAEANAAGGEDNVTALVVDVGA